MTRVNQDLAATIQSVSQVGLGQRKTNTQQINNSPENIVPVKSTQSTLSVAGLNAASSAAFTDSLNASLKAYGIEVPPALRITSGAGGFELSGDARNTQFKKMLSDNPSLNSGFENAIGGASAARKNALADVMNAFGGANPSSSMQNFLDNFEISQDPKAMSVKFDGQDMKVQELGDKGWEEVKSEGTFTSALIDAYAKYMLTHEVSVETKKNDESKDAQSKAADKKIDEVNIKS